MAKAGSWFLGMLMMGAAFQASAVSMDNSRQVAEASLAKWNEAFRRGRVEEILALYSDNAMLLTPSGQVSKNRSEIRAFWQALIERKAGEYSIDLVDVRPDKDDTIVAKAVLSSRQNLPSARQTMRYVYDGELFNVFKRQKDGSWKTEVQRWN